MQVILGLGTNQGNRFAALRSAIDKLSPHLKNLTRSHVYRSPALLKHGAPKEWNIDYLNMALMGETELAPEALLALCKQIETEMGRPREHEIWSPRIIDIDILTYGDEKYHSPTLTIPHAELLNRPFALLPLLELKPDYAPAPQPNGTTRIGHFA